MIRQNLVLSLGVKAVFVVLTFGELRPSGRRLPPTWASP